MARSKKNASDAGGESAAPDPGPGTKPVTSKADAIRAALAAGFEGPQEGTAFIRKEFGIEIGTQHFSAVKSQLKSRGPGSGRRGRPKGSKNRTIEGYLAPPRAPLPANADLIDVMESIKPLIAQYGAERVKRIVDLMG